MSLTYIQEKAAIEGVKKLSLLGVPLNEHGAIAICHAFMSLQPTGLVRVSKCSWYPHGNVPAELCPECHGKEIRTPLTQAEAVEVLKDALKGSVDIPPINILFPNGDRIEVER